MELWWVYLMIGASAGVLGSMLGVGGGILMVPAMVMICGIPQKPAAAMSLAIMIPMALTSTTRYLFVPEIRQGMRLLPVVLMAAAAIAGAFAGTELVKHLSGTTLKRIFAVIMILVAVKMFLEKDKVEPIKGSGGLAAPAGGPEAGAESQPPGE